MTPRLKIAVSLPADLVEAVRSAVEHGRAPSVSAYVEAALMEKTSEEEIREMLGEMLAETGGPTTKAERQEARRILRGVKSRKR